MSYFWMITYYSNFATFVFYAVSRMSESKTSDFSSSSIEARTMNNVPQPFCGLNMLLVGDDKTLRRSATSKSAAASSSGCGIASVATTSPPSTAASDATAKSAPPSYPASTATSSPSASTISNASSETKSNAASPSPATPAAAQDALLSGRIEEELFTLDEILTVDKPAGPGNNCSSTRVAVYKVHDAYILNHERRQELARVLPSMHAVVFVASSEKDGSNLVPSAKYDDHWKPFLNEHANQRMLRSFILPPNGNVVDKTVLVVEKAVCNWQQVVTVLSEDIIPAVATRLSCSEQQAMQAQLRFPQRPHSNSDFHLQQQQQQQLLLQQQGQQHGQADAGAPPPIVVGKLSMSAISPPRTIPGFAHATVGVIPIKAISKKGTILADGTQQLEGEGASASAPVTSVKENRGEYVVLVLDYTDHVLHIMYCHGLSCSVQCTCPTLFAASSFVHCNDIALPCPDILKLFRNCDMLHVALYTSCIAVYYSFLLRSYIVLCTVTL